MQGLKTWSFFPPPPSPIKREGVGLGNFKYLWLGALMGKIKVTQFLIILFSLFWLSLCSAEERILRFHSDIVVHEDASLTVKETIQVVSEGKEIKHGIYRDFPTRYSRLWGNRTVGFTVLEVLKNGQPEKYFQKRIFNGVRTYIGDQDAFIPPGEHTYTLVYKTDRQLGFFKDYDELYWNATGNEWRFPIEKASADVRLPQGTVQKIINHTAYTGLVGEKGEDFRTEIDFYGGVKFETAKPLALSEGLTIALSWPKGFVIEPDAKAKVRYFYQDNKGFFYGVIGLLVVLGYYLYAWVKVGRDPSKGVTVVRYAPPENMSPAEMRYFLRKEYDDKTLAAAIIDMAAKGYLFIKEEDGKYKLLRKEEGKTPLSSEEIFVLSKLLDSEKEMLLERENGSKIRSAAKELGTHLKSKYQSSKVYFISNKKYFLIGLLLSFIVFVIGGGGDAVETNSLPLFIFACFWLTPWSFYTFGILIPAAIKSWMNFKGRFLKRLLYLPSLLIITFFTLVFLTAELVALYGFSYYTSFLVSLSIALVVLVNVIFFYLLKNISPQARKMFDAIEGFKQFLVATEKDRLNMLNPSERTPELFEKYLPYALALDVEQRWAEQFSDVLADFSATGGAGGYSPSWYSGTGTGLASVSRFSSSFGNSFTDALSSSAPGLDSGGGGGGGSGGGGSSGGGGGGGGGGGW
jgi:uncharacterized membrane protein YgcG